MQLATYKQRCWCLGAGAGDDFVSCTGLVYKASKAVDQSTANVSGQAVTSRVCIGDNMLHSDVQLDSQKNYFCFLVF
jgi:hypothetical protein